MINTYLIERMILDRCLTPEDRTKAEQAIQNALNALVMAVAVSNEPTGFAVAEITSTADYGFSEALEEGVEEGNLDEADYEDVNTAISDVLYRTATLLTALNLREIED